MIRHFAYFINAHNTNIFDPFFNYCSVCDILSIFMRELRHLAHVIHVTAQIVFYTTLGCMAAQVNCEVDVRRASNAAYEALPTGELYRDQVISSDAEIIDEKFVKVV
jgi:hypothetical protein